MLATQIQKPSISAINAPIKVVAILNTNKAAVIKKPTQNKVIKTCIDSLQKATAQSLDKAAALQS